jgi:hypothetical protein
VRYEGVLLAEMAGTIGDVADVRAEVLLLGGALNRPGFIKPSTPSPGRSRATSASCSPASTMAAPVT